jgi:hypothetical protein
MNSLIMIHEFNYTFYMNSSIKMNSPIDNWAFINEFIYKRILRLHEFIYSQPLLPPTSAIPPPPLLPSKAAASVAVSTVAAITPTALATATATATTIKPTVPSATALTSATVLATATATANHQSFNHSCHCYCHHHHRDRDCATRIDPYANGYYWMRLVLSKLHLEIRHNNHMIVGGSYGRYYGEDVQLG